MSEKRDPPPKAQGKAISGPQGAGGERFCRLPWGPGCGPSKAWLCRVAGLGEIFSLIIRAAALSLPGQISFPKNKSEKTALLQKPTATPWAALTVGALWGIWAWPCWSYLGPPRVLLSWRPAPVMAVQLFHLAYTRDM